MHIEEVMKAQREMETEILKAAQSAISDFRAKTKMSPSRIDVELAEVTQLQDPYPHYMLANVKCTLDIGHPGMRFGIS